MAVTYVDSATLAVDATFVSRVTAAMERQAVKVGQALVANGVGSQADKARLALAQAALAQPSVYGSRFAWALACDPTVASDVDDPGIRQRVLAMWDVIAAVPV